MEFIIDKKLVDYQREGVRLKQGIEKTPNGDKVYLFVDSAWSKLPVDLRVYASNGRRFTKDDSLVVWRENDKYNAAVVSPLDRIDLFETINRKKESPSDDESILKFIQTAQPWLGRVNFSDTSFAEMLPKSVFVIVDDVSSNNDKDYATLDKGEIKINKSCGTLGILSASFVLWLRYVCLHNKNLYNNVLMNCFQRNSMCTSQNDKGAYVSKRLLNVNFENVIDDIYLIVKGYTDSTFTIIKEASSLLEANTHRLKEYALELDNKYVATERINGLFTNTELAKLFCRDMLSHAEVLSM